MSKRKRIKRPTFVPSKGFLIDKPADRLLPKSEALLKIEARQQEIAEAARARSNVTVLKKRSAK